MIPIIVISMGDPNGIGPEVTLKSLDKTDLECSIPVWIGSTKIFNHYSELLDINLPVKNFLEDDKPDPGSVYLLDLFDDSGFSIKHGNISSKAGEMAMQSVAKGIELCMNEQAHALVTASISKEAIHKAGYHVPGHTEFLAEKTGAEEVLMMLVTDELRVALSTIHIPLKDVAGSISIEKLKLQLTLLNESLKNDFGISSPKIGVLGLNPHAGDGGVIGTEEIKFIQPAVNELKQNGIKVEGPFAADGYFGNRIYQNFDATFAMYHDQGLIPFKALSFGKGVNFTAGLPIIRTSPDHGTAFDIAGKNRADEKSLRSAYKLALEMALNRNRSFVQ